MARYGISYSDVVCAIREIKDAGLEPTIDRVREILGTGSKTTISFYVKKYKNQNDEASDSTVFPITDSLSKAVHLLHQQLQTEAQKKIDQMQQELQEGLQAADQQVQSKDSENTQLLSQISALQEEVILLKEHNQQLKKSNISLEKDLVKNVSDNKHLSERVGELQSLIKHLVEENRATLSNFEHYQEKMAQDRADERNYYENIVDQLKSELSALERQLAGIQKHAIVLGEQINSTTSLYEKEASWRASLESSLNQSNEINQSLAQDNFLLKDRSIQLENKLAELEAKLFMKESRCLHLETKIKDQFLLNESYKNRISSMKKRLRELTL